MGEKYGVGCMRECMRRKMVGEMDCGIDIGFVVVR